MKWIVSELFVALAFCAGMASSAGAQSAEPTYKGDPSVYKIIFEDANFRVIESTRKAGLKDKAHSHPVPFVFYNVNDCVTKLYSPDGKVTENKGVAGTAGALPAIPSHEAENVGTTECKQIFVEKK